LLVVIAIIAILIGLLLPAVQKVRDAAARMKCSNNLKQFGLAIHGYNDTYNRIPPSGNNWANDTGSWLVQTLPYMEQGALYKAFNPTTNTDVQTSNDVNANYNAAGRPNAKLPYGQCPSDPGFPNLTCCSYVGSLGPQCAPGPWGCDPFLQYCNGNAFGWGYPTSPDHGNSTAASDIRGLFNRLGAKITLASITDGTSNTIAVGECIPAQHDHLQAGDWWDYNGGASHCTTIIPINTTTSSQSSACQTPIDNWSNWDKSWGFKSNHTNGANFVFADGSVHFIQQSIDMGTYQKLGCRNDNQPVQIP
jgi:prepilin-type processing-associated H-X9-DG protein